MTEKIEKPFMEKWKDFWFWFDGIDFLTITIGVAILSWTVIGGACLLRYTGVV